MSKAVQKDVRDEIVVENGTAKAVSAKTEVSCITVSHKASGASVTANGFVLNLRRYAEKAAPPGVLVRRVAVQSVGIYLRKATQKAVMAIFRKGAGEDVACSDPVMLKTSDEGALNTFLFPREVWLEADEAYEFKILGASGKYVSKPIMYFDTEFAVQGFKDGCNGTYSTREGCFAGESALKIETSQTVELMSMPAFREKMARKLDADKSVALTSNLSEVGKAADAKAVGDALNEVRRIAAQRPPADSMDDARHWHPGREYKTGTIVRHGRQIYCCLEDNSDREWAPRKWESCTLDDIVDALMSVTADVISERLGK